MIRSALVCIVFALLLNIPAPASEQFKDVPDDHWAASAVQKLKDLGVVEGYPDGTFRGNQPVTRYELAAALVRFSEFLQESVKPLSMQTQPRSGEAVQKTQPVAGSPAAALITGGFLPPDSPLAADTSKPVTTEQLADALASIAKRLIELTVPADSGVRSLSPAEGE
ncbi:MAG: S-layer homology domain-containing protein [Armatimonadota bacterium]